MTWWNPRQWIRQAGWEAEPPRVTPAAWERTARILQWLNRLDGDRRAALCSLAVQFLRTRHMETLGLGTPLTTDDRAIIALQACVPVLELGLDAYEPWETILIYPAGFVVEHEYEDESGVVHQERGPLIGEAWEGGPMVLSLEDALDPHPGTSVVIHECGHKLDLRNGVINGFPRLRDGMDPQAWTQAFTEAYDTLQGQLQAGREPDLDPYAAEDPGEFLAVTLEMFCADARSLFDFAPAVYRQWARLLGFDPMRK